MGDLPLWGIVAAFAVWEVFAHFVARNRGEHTLSNRVWALEARYPKTRVLVASLVALLFSHLVLQVP